jgi:hypothetical protein
MKLTTELFGANPNIPAWVADLIDFVEPESALEQMVCKLDITRAQAETIMAEVLEECFEPA